MRSPGQSLGTRRVTELFFEWQPTFFDVCGNCFETGISFIHSTNSGEMYMTSKKMWIVGGIVVAIGAVAYLSLNTTPASSDAAGTIVEANRTVTDGATATTTATEPTAAATEVSAADTATAPTTTDASAAADASDAANGGD